MPRKKTRAPHSADTRGGGFAGIPICVVHSEAYRHLSLFARAVLIEIVSRMRGHNNGHINISYAEIAYRLNRKNQAPIGPAIAQLMSHGLIDVAFEGDWKQRRAREYRLTFVNTTDEIGRPIKATNDYLGWKSRPTDAVAGKRKSTTPFVAGKIAAATTLVVQATEGEGNFGGPAATDVVTPINNPYPLAPPSSGGVAHHEALLELGRPDAVFPSRVQAAKALPAVGAEPPFAPKALSSGGTDLWPDRRAIHEEWIRQSAKLLRRTEG